MKITEQASVYLKFLHQEGNVSCSELKRRYPQYALRSIYRHAKGNIVTTQKIDKRKFNCGRPRKITVRDERNILRSIYRLRNEQSSFTAKRIQEEANLAHVHIRTIVRYLNKHGFKYRQARKKGLLTKQDKIKRTAFAKEMLKSKREDFWKKEISFYFDGVGFAHKRNPHGEARATGTMAWRKPKEGLRRTTKGRKEGSGGKMAHFFVAIAYNKGTVLCKQYTDRLTGASFGQFVREYFPAAFERSADPHGKLFLQDGDPRQGSKAARAAMDEIECTMFPIPPRSPDLNPIENMFHSVRRQLAEDALRLEIKRETFREFSCRVRKTIKRFPVATLDKTIDSMNKRLQLVVKGKGDRTKY